MEHGKVKNKNKNKKTQHNLARGENISHLLFAYANFPVNLRQHFKKHPRGRSKSK